MLVKSVSPTGLVTHTQEFYNSERKKRLARFAEAAWKAGGAAFGVIADKAPEIPLDVDEIPVFLRSRENNVFSGNVSGERKARNEEFRREFSVNECPSLALIKRAVCRRYNLTPAQLVSGRRNKTYIMARWSFIYLADMMTTFSLTVIARETGGRDHTTILHGRKAAIRLLANDEIFSADIAAIKHDVVSVMRQA